MEETIKIDFGRGVILTFPKSEFKYIAAFERTITGAHNDNFYECTLATTAKVFNFTLRPQEELDTEIFDRLCELQNKKDD